MLSVSYRLVVLNVLAFVLALSAPACAQTKNAPPPALSNSQQAPGNWDDQTLEHQEFREEMMQIRKEHEDLEAARDKLMDTCVNVTREQADACIKERQQLHERQMKLHERTHALHEKMRAAQPAGQQPEPASAPANNH